jgi:hypothetical protein
MVGGPAGFPHADVEMAGLSAVGLQIYIGRTVVLDTGKVQIVLLGRHIEPTAQEMLQVLGIDPARKKYVAIKSCGASSGRGFAGAGRVHTARRFVLSAFISRRQKEGHGALPCFTFRN